MFQAKFDEAKYLTLGVGAVNVTFTLVAVSPKPIGYFYISRALHDVLLKSNHIIHDIISADRYKLNSLLRKLEIYLKINAVSYFIDCVINCTKILDWR